MSHHNVHPERHRSMFLWECVCVRWRLSLPGDFSIFIAVFRNRCNIGSGTSSWLESLRQISPQSILHAVPANFTLSLCHSSFQTQPPWLRWFVLFNLPPPKYVTPSLWVSPSFTSLQHLLSCSSSVQNKLNESDWIDQFHAYHSFPGSWNLPLWWQSLY